MAGGFEKQGSMIDRPTKQRGRSNKRSITPPRRLSRRGKLGTTSDGDASHLSIPKPPSHLWASCSIKVTCFTFGLDPEIPSQRIVIYQKCLHFHEVKLKGNLMNIATNPRFKVNATTYNCVIDHGILLMPIMHSGERRLPWMISRSYLKAILFMSSLNLLQHSRRCELIPLMLIEWGQEWTAETNRRALTVVKII